jgi:hypothetical protein
LSSQQRKHFPELREQPAWQIAEKLARKSGLHFSFEATEALDRRYPSRIGESIREAYRQLLTCTPLPENLG